jgi:hypothetical protein
MPAATDDCRRIEERHVSMPGHNRGVPHSSTSRRQRKLAPTRPTVRELDDA